MPTFTSQFKHKQFWTNYMFEIWSIKSPCGLTHPGVFAVPLMASQRVDHLWSLITEIWSIFSFRWQVLNYTMSSLVTASLIFVWFAIPVPRRAIHGPEITQQPMGQEESELASDKELEGSFTSYQNQQGALSLLSGERALTLRSHYRLMEWCLLEPLAFCFFCWTGYWVKWNATGGQMVFVRIMGGNKNTKTGTERCVI